MPARGSVIRATPASTSVSSTLRSCIRRRVIAGSASDREQRPVPVADRPPGHLAAEPPLGLARDRIRCCRVSSRKPWILAFAASARAVSVASAPVSGVGSVPTTRSLVAVRVTSSGPSNQSSGSRPVNQAWTSLVSCSGVVM